MCVIHSREDMIYATECLCLCVHTCEYGVFFVCLFVCVCAVSVCMCSVLMCLCVAPKNVFFSDQAIIIGVFQGEGGRDFIRHDQPTMLVPTMALIIRQYVMC